MLSDPAIESEVSQAIKEYFTLNALPETPISTVWTAHKAVLRGELISIYSACNKLNREKIVALSTEVDSLYKNTEALKLEATRISIDQKRLELDALLTTKVEKSLRWSKAKCLLHSNSSSTMFARKLNQSARPQHVYKLASGPGLST